MAEEQEHIEAQEQETAQPTQEQDAQMGGVNSDELAQQSDTMTETTLSLEEQLARLQDTHLRLMAEYDNYRKRTLKEKSDLIKNGGEKALRDLIPVIDDLDIALANIHTTDDIEALREGVRLIQTKFVDYLSRQGVKAIEAVGAVFDDELHEAIATFPASDDEGKGKIIDCVKKGYTLHDKVLRHASVVVGQ